MIVSTSHRTEATAARLAADLPPALSAALTGTLADELRHLTPEQRAERVPVGTIWKVGNCNYRLAPGRVVEIENAGMGNWTRSYCDVETMEVVHHANRILPPTPATAGATAAPAAAGHEEPERFDDATGPCVCSCPGCAEPLPTTDAASRAIAAHTTPGGWRTLCKIVTGEQDDKPERASVYWIDGRYLDWHGKWSSHSVQFPTFKSFSGTFDNEADARAALASAMPPLGVVESAKPGTDAYLAETVEMLAPKPAPLELVSPDWMALVLGASSTEQRRLYVNRIAYMAYKDGLHAAADAIRARIEEAIR